MCLLTMKIKPYYILVCFFCAQRMASNNCLSVSWSSFLCFCDFVFSDFGHAQSMRSVFSSLQCAKHLAFGSSSVLGWTKRSVHIFFIAVSGSSWLGCTLSASVHVCADLRCVWWTLFVTCMLWIGIKRKLVALLLAHLGVCIRVLFCQR